MTCVMAVACQVFLPCACVVKSYQNFACSANIPGNRANHEYALHLLQTCNGHIKVIELSICFSLFVLMYFDICPFNLSMYSFYKFTVKQAILIMMSSRR